MAKIVFIVAVLLALVWWARKQKTTRPRATETLGQKTQRDTSTRSTSLMVPCYRCGVYFPEADAVVVAGENYCSAAHAQAARDER